MNRPVRRPNGTQLVARGLVPLAIPGGAIQPSWLTAARHAHLFARPIADTAAEFSLTAEQVGRAWRALYPGEVTL